MITILTFWVAFIIGTIFAGPLMGVVSGLAAVVHLVAIVGAAGGSR